MCSVHFTVRRMMAERGCVHALNMPPHLQDEGSRAHGSARSTRRIDQFVHVLFLFYYLEISGVLVFNCSKVQQKPAKSDIDRLSKTEGEAGFCA